MSTPGGVDAVVRHRDLVIGERPTGALLLDLVVPGGADDAVPVVLWLHGGGWFTGDRHLAPDLEALAARHGLAFASAEYRLSGQALFPAQLHDVRTAVRYLRRHGTRLGVDPAAIGVWGASAGGHLAALAGLTGGVDRLPGEDESGDAAVRAVCDGYGPVDLARVVAQASVPALAGANAPEARLLGAPPDEAVDLARAASPLTHVRPGAPPFLLAHGLADALVRPEQSRLLHDALVAAGVPSELWLIDGYGHGFFNRRADPEVPDAPAFLDEGHLEADGEARATRFDAAGPDGVAAEFSFAVVADFFRRHLLAPRPEDPR